MITFDTDQCFMMLKTLILKLIEFIKISGENIYTNNAKLKQISTKFSNIVSKNRLELPNKVLIDDIQKKKKMDFSNNFDLGLNNLTLAFSELFKVFDLLVNLSEQLSFSFASLIERFQSKYDWIDLTKLTVCVFFDFLNKDPFLKYTAIAIKNKNIRVNEIYRLEKLIFDSQGQKEKIDKMLENEMKSMFEKKFRNKNKSEESNNEGSSDDDKEIKSKTVDEAKKHLSQKSKKNRKISVNSQNSSKDTTPTEHSDLDSLLNYITQDSNKQGESAKKPGKKGKKQSKFAQSRKLRTKSDLTQNEEINLSRKEGETELNSDRKKEELAEDSENHKYKKCIENYVYSDCLKSEENIHFVNIKDEECDDEKEILLYKNHLANQSIHSAFVYKIKIDIK